MEAQISKKRKASQPSVSPQERSFETPEVRSNGRVRGSVSQTKFSPIRAGRLEEKQELQELNKRLELYILWQRERDAAQTALQKELSGLRDSFETEKRILETQLQQEREQQQAKREETTAQLTRLAQESERQAALADQYKRQLEKEQKSHSQHKTLNASLTRENQTLKNKLLTAEEERKSAIDDLEAEREEHERIKGDLAREQKRADEISKQVEKERTRADKSQEALELETAKSREWMTKYREIVAETSQGRQALEDELRKDFTNQLTDLLAHHNEIAEKEKTEALANLQDFHEKKAREKTEALEQALKKVDTLQAQMRELQFKESVATREALAAKGIKENLERIISELNVKYSELDRRHKDEVEEKEKIIGQIRTRLSQQDDEFNSLIDVKIHLAMEIKAYRLLLDAEEDRLEIRPKRSDKKDTASVIIARMDLEGDRITVRNGSTETADLAGWRLMSQKTTKEFAFPRGIILPAGESIVVHTGLDAADKVKSSHEIAWVAEGIWDEDGDVALLHDPQGRVASNVIVTSSSVAEE